MPIFLFTDIEQSTKKWEQAREAMGAALRMHDELIGNAVAAHDGTVFKHTGDGICAVFESPTHALRAAARAQRELTTTQFPVIGEIRVRMGVHAGGANEVDGDFFGPTLNRVARVMGAAHGSQTLVTDAVEALDPELEPLGLKTLGEHRLRDLAEPMTLFQLTGPGLPAQFPAIKSLDAVPHNLPAERSEFLGREAELREIATALEHSRLVTVVGPGGVGKTRAALHCAAEMSGTLPDGVWFVDLAPLSDGALIATAVLEALRLRVEGTRGHLDTVIDHIGDRRVLLLIDNCEHLVDASAAVVDALLGGSPNVHVLATSREPLHVSGESVYPLPPMATDGPGSAAELFRLRGEAMGVEMTSSTDDDSVADICRRLDGLPLAIELAAARLRSMSAREIADRLDQRFRLLTGGSRSAMARQRTLEATVTWSYDQLEPDVQLAFEVVSTFAGGFELDAAMAVLGDDELTVLDRIDQLVDRSLAVSSPEQAATRYTMLETMRQYGRDQLAGRGEMAEYRDRHLRWVCGLAVELSPSLQVGEPAAMARIDRELANVRIGLDWACSPELATEGLQLMTSLGRYWFNRTIMHEGRTWLLRLMGEADDLDDLLHAEALSYLGLFTLEVGDESGSLEPLQQAVELARRIDHPDVLCRALQFLSRGAFGLLDPAAVLAWVDEGRSLAIQTEDPFFTFLHSIVRVIWYAYHGTVDEAVTVGRDFVTTYVDTPVPTVRAHTCEVAAIVALLEQDEQTAAQHLRAALTSYREVGNLGCTSHAVEAVAWLQATAGNLDDATDLLRSVEALRARHHAGRPVFEAFSYSRAEALLNDLFGADERPGTSPLFDDPDDAIDIAVDRLDAYLGLAGSAGA